MRKARPIVVAALLASALFLLPSLSSAAGSAAAWRSTTEVGLFELLLDWVTERWESPAGGDLDRILQPSGPGIDPNGPPYPPPPPTSDATGGGGEEEG